MFWYVLCVVIFLLCFAELELIMLKDYLRDVSRITLLADLAQPRASARIEQPRQVLLFTPRFLTKCCFLPKPRYKMVVSGKSARGW